MLTNTVCFEMFMRLLNVHVLGNISLLYISLWWLSDLKCDEQTSYLLYAFTQSSRLFPQCCFLIFFKAFFSYFFISILNIFGYKKNCWALLLEKKSIWYPTNCIRGCCVGHSWALYMRQKLQLRKVHKGNKYSSTLYWDVHMWCKNQ